MHHMVVLYETLDTGPVVITSHTVHSGIDIIFMLCIAILREEAKSK